MSLSQKQQGHVIMVFVILLFGLNIPITKHLFSENLISPFGILALRMSFATVLFWIISLFLPKEKVAKKDMLILAFGGACGMLLNQGLFAFGLGETSPVNASIITTSSPLFALVIAAIILKEPITTKKAGGVLLGIAGAVFLVYSSHQGSSNDDNKIVGDVAIMGAQLFYSFYLVITRPLSTKYSPITLMKWMFLYASMISFPLFYKNILEAPLFAQSSIEPFLAIGFVLIGATFFTYLLIPLAQRRIRPTTISMYNNAQPIVASSVAIFAGQDKFTIEKLIAALVIFVGVYLVTTSKSREDIEIEAKTKPTSSL